MLPQVIETVPTYTWNSATGLFDAVIVTAEGNPVVTYAIRPAIFVEIQRAVEKALDVYFACPESNATVIPLRRRSPG